MNAKMTRLMGKRILAVLLALALSTMMVPAIAFADGGGAGNQVDVKADNTDKTVETGDINVDTGHPGVKAEALNEGTATIKAGNVTSDGGNGITADATELGVIVVNVGNITSTRDNGIQARVEGDGDITVNAGDISSGDIGSGIWTSVDNRNIVKNSTITVNAGNVTAEGEGVVMRPYAQSQINVTVKDVIAKEDGVQIVAEEGGVVHFVAENVTAGRTGLAVYINEGSTVDAVITGTLTGGKAAYTLFGSSFVDTSRFTLTVWKIDFDAVGNLSDEEIAQLIELQLAATDTPEGHIDLDSLKGKTDFAKSFEESISYIMRLGQTEGATLSATYADGTPIKPDEHGFSVAKEGEEVLLKVSLEEGCELVAAYNGNGDKIQLLKADDGSYYIAYKVPKGGGIGLSVEVSAPFADTAIDKVLSASAAATKPISALIGGVDKDATLPATGDSLPALPFVLSSVLAAAVLALASAKCREPQPRHARF